MRPGKRKAVLLCIGIALIAIVWGLSWLVRPTPAPSAVQESGRILAGNVITKVRMTPFGQSERGRLLSDALQRQLDRDAVVFSADMGGPRGLTRFRWLRDPLVYIRVIQVTESNWLHQLDWQLAEALYHEAVHVINGGIGRASFEEECDAFCAGLEAEAAVRGLPSPERLTIDGMAVAEFVHRSYPRASRRSGYRPIGADMAWLRKRAEIEDF